MINVYVAIFIWFFHWAGDFVMQSNEQALGKSTNNTLLSEHVFIYSLLFTIISIFAVATTLFPIRMILFGPITFICHWITDYFTSRINSRLWKVGNNHDFFVSVGFDQFLHLTQLLLTYKLLS